MSTLDPLIRNFCKELRARGFLNVALIEAALLAIDTEGDGNPDAAACWEAIRWVLSRNERGAGEKMEALGKLLNNKGVIRLPEDLGWT
jgi:hypothetical protein